MTIEELNALYDRAHKLVVSRSAAAARKALVFNTSSLEDAMHEISDMYELTVEERSRLASGTSNNALTTVQQTATTLLGERQGMSASRAIGIAKTARDGGRKVSAIAALLKAGPSAAEAAAAGGKIASKASVWGWIATGASAAGTGSWFVYNLRTHSLAAYEVRRLREGINAPAPQASITETASAQMASALEIAGDGAKIVGDSAGTAMRETIKGGGWLLGAAKGLFGR